MQALEYSLAQWFMYSSDGWQIPVQVLSPAQVEEGLELGVSHIPDEYPVQWAKSYEGPPLVQFFGKMALVRNPSAACTSLSLRDRWGLAHPPVVGISQCIG